MLKVGDKVRVVVSTARAPVPHHVGRTGVIISGKYGHYDWKVVFDSPGPGAPSQYFYSHELAPLAPPERDESAERFVESLKKLAREPLPLTKEKA